MKGAEERGGLRVHNVGGSLTFLLQIALVAFCVRQLRSVLAKRKDILSQRKGQLTMPHRPVDHPPFVSISPLALLKLLKLDSIPYLVIDVRFPGNVLPDSFPGGRTVNIPEPEIRLCLDSANRQWGRRFPSLKHPDRGDLLLFLSTTGRRAQRAAAAASEVGYSGSCAVDGGLVGYLSAMQSPSLVQPKYLSRDAVALLLYKASINEVNCVASPERLLLVDVRRHDERALYGFIEGSLHLPVEEWPRALATSCEDWEKKYHFPKFQFGDTIILYGQTLKRASWVAQLACDAGFERCYVYANGSYGWRLDFDVLPYESFRAGDVPPEPLNLETELVDYESAALELGQEGLL